jgi:ADP-ribose pyrophosphatase YjhB (NUDIX family)
MECRVHKLIADVAVFAQGHVLLVRYRDVARYDGQRGWFLPDDHLAHLEHPADTAQRILDEQVGLAKADVRLATIESFGNGAWHLTFHFRADLEGLPQIDPGDNVADAEWFPLDGMPDADDVAHHGWALDVVREMTPGPEGG